MKELKINTFPSYTVSIGNGLLSKAGLYLHDAYCGSKAMIVSDDTVFGLYGDLLTASLSDNGIMSNTFIFPHGEQSKEFSTYSSLIEKLYICGFQKQDVIIALGGGVTGDIAGFAASTFYRGIDLIQIPTTLLACVDSSVGGKNGINLYGAKNQVGTFYQPVAVICDTSLLSTLPHSEYINGCAEIIKYGFINDNNLLSDIESTDIKENLENVIFECLNIKRRYVETDEHDNSSRKILNFGHTVGHAVESLSNYSISHGCAVAYGMKIITSASVKRGICSPDTLCVLTRILRKYELDRSYSFSAYDICNAAKKDKKAGNGEISLIVPQNPGKCEIKAICFSDLYEWIRDGGIE